MSNKLKIYLSGHIVGVTKKDLQSYFLWRAGDLEGLGFQVFTPFLTEFDKVQHSDGNDPANTGRSIVGRDNWMVRNSDIVFCNLTALPKKVSIGSVSEIILASELGKYVIVIMQKENIHQHIFVQEAADVIFENHEDAIEHLKLLRFHS